MLARAWSCTVVGTAEVSYGAGVELEELGGGTAGAGAESSGSGAADWKALGAAHLGLLLGAGKRHFFNPYLGFRVAYVYADQVSELGLGGNVGLEIYRGSMLLVDSQLRAQAVFGSSARVLHLALQPTVAVSAAF